MRSRARKLLTLACTGAALALVECLQPTEIVLKLDTDVPCGSLQGVAVSTGSPGDVETKAAGTVTSDCQPGGQIGTLVLIPTGSKDEELAIRIVAGSGQAVESCQPPSYGPGCIVARRILRYIPHTPLTLPVALRQACAGVSCTPDETCVDGMCKSSTIPDPSSCAQPGGCSENGLPSAEGGPDLDSSGRPDAPSAIDGTAAMDSSSDSPPQLEASDDAASDATSSDAAFDAASSDAGSEAAPPSDASADAPSDAAPMDSASDAPAGGDAGTPIVLTVGNTASSIAVDSVNVYFANSPPGVSQGSVSKIPLAGGTVTQLAGGLDNPHGMSVDATKVYWGTNNGYLESVPIAGGTVATLATDSFGKPWNTAVDTTTLYWTDRVLNSISSISVGGGTATTLASGLTTPNDLAVDSANLYFTESGLVARMAKSGGAIATLATGSAPAGIATDGTYVYWVDNTSGVVARVPVAGGSLITLASGQSAPWDIAVDGSYVYWTSSGDGTVKKVPLGGGTPTVLASAQSTPEEMALGASVVVWVNKGTSQIMMVGK